MKSDTLNETGQVADTGTIIAFMSTTEHTINDALAAALRGTRRAWADSAVVSSENTGMLKGGPKRPDILVIEPNVSPVVIETEVLPAATVERDAVSRLGEKLSSTGRTILSAIAVRLPIRLRNKQGLPLNNAVNSATDLEMVLYTGSSAGLASRWPSSGWMIGNIADLSVLAQSASVPPDVIEEAANSLVSGVAEAASLLEEMVKEHAGAFAKIGKELCQEDDVQTRRMAAAIVANALVFHETLAGGPADLADVRSLDEIRGASGTLNRSDILAEWRKVLKVNYWPIFDIARRILQVIPADHSVQIIERLAKTAQRLLENSLMRSHDLAGAVFQRLIIDRKFLAAFYTTPSAASLLVGLAISPEATPAGKPWSDPRHVKSLRIADFACGTGTLLSTAYQRIGQLHELAGGDAESLHPAMMAEALVGCDVLPAAAHLTASMLAGAHPTVKYDQSSVMTVAYGQQPDGDIALGSLALLDPQAELEILSITAKAAEGMGEKEKQVWATLPHASFDLVVMNPPFTRPTSHEGRKKDVPNPMFAAFGSSADEQKLMAEATKRLTAGTSAHGNAGEASVFLVLGHRKVKDRGVLAMVMPLSLLGGESWEGSRALLSKYYSDLVVVSIAGSGGGDLSFSADTDMAECLIVGRKRKLARQKTLEKKETNRATFVVLNERPAFPMLGYSTARQIRQMIVAKNVRSLENGPFGGTLLRFGNDAIGHAVQADLPEGWNLSRVADIALAQVAYQLVKRKRLWLPGTHKSTAVHIPITTAGNIGTTGPIHRDINGKTPTGGIRGPFSIIPSKPDGVPTYPALWAHDAKREQTLSFEGDSEAVPVLGATDEEQESIDEKVSSIWATASHCHCNLDFRFNSQSTSMQFTPRPTIGGRAWISLQLPSVADEKAMVLWANTSMGLLLHWWHANKQQPGRGSIGKSTLQSLPVLDVTALTAAQLDESSRIFDAISKKELRPLHQIDEDAVRRELDEHFGLAVLGLPSPMFAPGGPFELLRMKLAKEPSIRGQKTD
jgi:hypothetical protein